jgi:Flp pilus assembly protein TadD
VSRQRASVRITLALAVALASSTPTATLAKKKPPEPLALPMPVTIDPATALPIIDTAIAEGRAADAGAVLQRALTSADTPELQLRAGEIALIEGGLAAAATSFTGLVNEPIVAARAHQGLGITRLRQGRTEEAIKSLDAALSADPVLLRATIARGVAADRLRDWPRADAAWARALELAPQSAIARNNRGWSLLLRGRHGEAEADFVAALDADPRLGSARTNLIFARALQGRYREAFTLSEKTTLAADLNTVGFGAMARGDNEAAQSYFERAMQKNPRFDRTAWANLQYLFEQTRDARSALNGPATDDPAPMPGSPLASRPGARR